MRQVGKRSQLSKSKHLEERVLENLITEAFAKEGKLVRWKTSAQKKHLKEDELRFGRKSRK